MLGDAHPRFRWIRFRQIDELFRTIGSKNEFVLVSGAAMDHHDGGVGNRFATGFEQTAVNIPVEERPGFLRVRISADSGLFFSDAERRSWKRVGETFVVFKRQIVDKLVAQSCT